MLLLAIASYGLRVGLPIAFLVMGMSLAPLSLAVADDFGVDGIGETLLALVLVTALGLTLRVAANGLVRTVFGWPESLLAKRAAAERGNQFLGGLFCLQTLRKSDRR